MLAAARWIADGVQPAIVEEAVRLAAGLGERASVVAAAIAEVLYDRVLREDTARWLAIQAETEPGAGTVATRTAIGKLCGFSRQGLERRLVLTGNGMAGREGRTAREVADEILHAQWRADEGLTSPMPTPRP